MIYCEKVTLAGVAPVAYLVKRMRRKPFIVLLCLWWCMGFIFAQSQPPMAAGGDKKSQPPNELAQQNNSQTHIISSNTSTSDSYQKITSSTKSAENNKSSLEDPIVWFTAAMLIVMIFQWRTYERALATSKAQLRAYLSIELDDTPRVDPDVKTRIIFFSRNYGSTPAKEVIWRGKVIDISEGEVFPEISGTWDGKHRTIFPNNDVEEIGNFWYFADDIFTVGQINQCFLSKRRFAVGMEIIYIDIFGEKHTTRECYYIPSIRDGRTSEKISGGSLIN